MRVADVGRWKGTVHVQHGQVFQVLKGRENSTRVHDWQRTAFEKVKTGVDTELEEIADAILAEDRRARKARGKREMADYNDILLTDQLILRETREVYNKNGVPDAALIRGIYGRAWNPLANTRPTNRRRYAHDVDTWNQDLYESLDSMPGFAIPSWLREEITSGMHYQNL